MLSRLRRHRGRPGERGAVLPSPVVILSVLAVTFAAVALVVTMGGEPAERAIDTAAVTAEEPAEESTTEDSEAQEAEPAEEEPPPPPPVTREKIGVVVFNNTNVRGLAGKVSAQVEEIGWKVTGADNWYGTIPATTVYHPPGMKRAANQLALDLGVERVMPAVDTMSTERLTLILTGELD